MTWEDKQEAGHAANVQRSWGKNATCSENRNIRNSWRDEAVEIFWQKGLDPKGFYSHMRNPDFRLTPMVNYWKIIRKIILVAIWRMDWIKQVVAARKEAVVKCQVSYHGGWIDARKARKEKKKSGYIQYQYLVNIWMWGIRRVRLSWGISKAWLSPTQVSQGAQQMVTPFYSVLCFSTELFYTYGCHALFFSAVVIVKILVCHWLVDNRFIPKKTQFC